MSSNFQNAPTEQPARRNNAPPSVDTEQATTAASQSSERSESAASYSSPLRHHQRTGSLHRTVKETRNAHSEYSNSQDDGTSQLRINQYLIRQEIGRGSFGAVHLATDQYDKDYAVKEFSKSRLRRRAQSNLLRRPRTGQPSFGGVKIDWPGSRPAYLNASNASSEASAQDPFDLIKEEIAVMKKLDHPNLVSLIEVLDDPEEDSLFMVLEMCKKGVVMKIEVEDAVEPYEEEECRTWFRDLLLGIEYLHAQGVVHRDIKPDNCLLTEDDTLKIVDFGVSEMFEKTTEMRIAKSAGSPAFMAPELCRVNHGGVSGKSADIWSMGVTLYCLRFGKVPFRNTSVLDLYSSITTDDIPLPPSCDPNLADLIFKLLEKDPNKRIEMEKLRDHPWVTRNGEDPLLSAEENCSELLQPPTDMEMDQAITGNMGGIMAVMKAVQKFKSLLDKDHRGAFQSILGQASKFVRPPAAFSKSDDTGPRWSSVPQHIMSRDIKAARDVLVEQGDKEGASLVSKLVDLPEQLRNAVLLSTTEADVREERASEAPLESPDLMRTLRKVKSDPLSNAHPYAKGHAHNVLEDYHYLKIGQGPTSEGSGTDGTDETTYVVSESPPAADFNVFERAYNDDVKRITTMPTKSATVYLTRRVESSLSSKIVTDTANATLNVAAPTGVAAASALSNLVSKVTDAARGATQAGKEEPHGSETER
ncbi:MAG: hypothetical protein M1828_001760 [Chrysothrix sp. TS-e1954]|nr:MAG: hypothetical protein M1828_001760 [Chrysothrix sp. TS-e1954]